MNKPLSEKEKLITMLTEIYDQLEELEFVLEASFSDQRISLNKEEQDQIKASEQKLAALDKTMEIMTTLSKEEISAAGSNQGRKSLKFELGF